MNTGTMNVEVDFRCHQVYVCFIGKLIPIVNQRPEGRESELLLHLGVQKHHSNHCLGISLFIETFLSRILLSRRTL